MHAIAWSLNTTPSTIICAGAPTVMRISETLALVIPETLKVIDVIVFLRAKI